MAQAIPQTNYLHGYKDVKHHELRTAESDAAYLLPTLSSMATANPHLKLLDVGAGSGTISASLAKHIPQGQVIAVDLSHDILARAAECAREASATNIHFQAASAFDLPFPDSSFDIVHASQMLCYQREPVAALKEMLRVLRPGGVAAVRECDMRMWSFWPQLPALEKFLRVQLATHEASGGSNFAGPQLISWALEAGMERAQVQFSAGTWCYSEPEDRQVWGGSWAARIRAGAMGRKAVSMGLADANELEEMARAWEEWAAADDGCFAAIHGEVLIRK